MSYSFNHHAMKKKELWTKSSTKTSLTFYAEALAVKNFNRRLLYVNVQVLAGIWYVCFNPKSISDATDNPMPRFVRLRTVKLVDGFMTCTCGYPQRTGCPCVHILCILDYDCPSLHHPRWWRDYNYHYLRCIKFTKYFDKVLSKLKNNSGIYIENPMLLISDKLPHYGHNFTDDTMVYVKWLLGFYKSSTPIVAGTVTFDPNEADSDGEFDPECEFSEQLNLSQLSQCEQIFKSATADKFVKEVDDINVDINDYKSEKVFYSEGVAKWKEISKMAAGNNEAHRMCMLELSVLEHNIRDLLLSKLTLKTPFLKDSKRIYSEYESSCIESETQFNGKRYKYAYEM